MVDFIVAVQSVLGLAAQIWGFQNPQAPEELNPFSGNEGFARFDLKKAIFTSRENEYTPCHPYVRFRAIIENDPDCNCCSPGVFALGSGETEAEAMEELEKRLTEELARETD